MKTELRMPLRIVAMRDRDEASLIRSASGGAFAVLARGVLRRGGVVFGACLRGDGRVRHIEIADENELYLLQGSKYVRSDVARTFEACANHLREGREVLYSGTPCQIAALISRLDSLGLLPCAMARLVTVDLICHGTPDGELFVAHQAWLAKKMGADGNICGWEFRNKKFGWGLCYHYYYYRNGVRCDKWGLSGDDPYYHEFLKGTIYRKACYRCSFAQRERVGDFTIGDYWGVQNVLPQFFDSRGVSALLMNTQKACDMFERDFANCCEWEESALEDVVRYQHNLRAPTRRAKEDEHRMELVDEALKEGDYETVFEELLSIDRSAKARIARAMPSSLLKIALALHRKLG